MSKRETRKQKTAHSKAAGRRKSHSRRSPGQKEKIWPINRFYKDRLFHALFGAEERKELTLELYNAINHTDYSNPADLKLNTLEDMVYMGMKNDVSFLLAGDLNMFEQQSTWNPNMPVRCFLYAAHALEKYLNDTKKAPWLYTSSLVEIPTPKLVVLYNGLKQTGDTVLKLSDSFEHSRGDLEAIVHVYNINPGQELPCICRPLNDYSSFVSNYRNLVPSLGPKTAADEALARLPTGAVKNYIQSQKGEVIDMLLTEYNEEEVWKTIRESEAIEARKEARKEAEQEAEKKFKDILAEKDHALSEKDQIIAQLKQRLAAAGR